MKTTLLCSTLFLTAGLAVGATPALASIQTAQTDSSPQKANADGSVKCPVTGKMLAKGKGHAAQVQGHTYKVADEAAEKELLAHPDQYLQTDGTPKNQ